MTTARALLDAHVQFEVGRLTGPALATTIAEVVDDVLGALGEHQLDDLIGRDALADAATTLLTAAPASPLAAGVVEMATELVHGGQVSLPPLAEVADRELVESLLDQVLALSPLAERALDRLTESPLVGTVAARFMGRIVSEVVATNQEIANKVPGLGSLVSFGTSAANLVKGAADKQLEALLGSSIDKGSTFAVRRLNKILLETLADPVTREALLQVWDLAASEPVNGLDAWVSLDDATTLTATLHELGLGALAHESVPGLVRVVVDAFLDRFGGYTPVELLEQLDLGRNDVVAHLAALAPQVVTELDSNGDLERLVRARLTPFYESDAARALLG